MPPLRNRPPRASVLVATYENPAALALVFGGLARQTTNEFEVIIADDGSGDATRAVVGAFAERKTVPVRHVWQNDEGVRKGKILNRALLDARAEYVIFLDGDIVPARDFVARHLELARPRTYLSGSCVLLGPAASRTLTAADVAGGALDGLRSCRRGNRRARRVAARRIPGLAAILDRAASEPVGFHGGNASVSREDALAIGGFDERLARFEDKDFGHRLRLRGLRGASVRYRIPAWHLHHERPYANQRLREYSRALFEANVAEGRAYTEHGLVRRPSYDRDAVADTKVE